MVWYVDIQEILDYVLCTYISIMYQVLCRQVRSREILECPWSVRYAGSGLERTVSQILGNYITGKYYIPIGT